MQYFDKNGKEIKAGMKILMRNRKCDLVQLSKNIHRIITDYDINGIKEHLGSKSPRAVINALKRFKEFLEK